MLWLGLSCLILAFLTFLFFFVVAPALIARGRAIREEPVTAAWRAWKAAVRGKWDPREEHDPRIEEMTHEQLKAFESEQRTRAGESLEPTPEDPLVTQLGNCARTA
jgi:hypothetical protein